MSNEEQTPKRSHYEEIAERELELKMRQLAIAEREVAVHERELDRKIEHTTGAHQEWRDHVARVEARSERIDREHAEHIAEWKAHVEEWRAECARERDQLDEMIAMLKAIATRTPYRE